MALQILLSVLATSWISLIYLTIGEIFRKRVQYNCDSLIEKLIIDTSLGFGISGFSIMLLNFAGFASPAKIILFYSILTLISLPHLIRFLLSIRNVPVSIRIKKYLHTGSISLFYYLLPLFLLFLYFLRTLLPPSGFDALMYHLSCAQLYLDHGGFYNIFFNPQSDFPMMTEMNFMVGLALKNDLICRQMSLLTECIAMGTLILFCRVLSLSREKISLAVSSLLTLTVTIASISSCDVDFAMASWIALSVYTLVKTIDQYHTKQFIIPAFFAGMAMSTKIFGVFVIPVLLFILIYKKKFSLRILFSLFIIPVIMGFPWYLKSLLHKGTLTSINISLIESQGLGLPMGFDISNRFVHFIVTVILRMTAAPWTFSLFPSQHQQDTFGPLFTVFLPFALLVKLSSKSKLLLAISGVYLACILLMEMLFIPGGSSIRYSLVLPVFCIPVCMIILNDMEFKHRLISRVLMLFLLIQISLGSILLIKRYHHDWIALLTLKNRDAYYSSILPEYPAIRFINAMPENCTIMTQYNYDNYLIKKNYISAYRHYTDKNALLEDLQRYSVSYIFANNVLDITSNATAFQGIDKTTVFSANGFYVYKISAFSKP